MYVCAYVYVYSIRTIYASHPYMCIQDAGRLLENGDEDSLTYGEIEFVPFLHLLGRLNLAPGGVFCDLGAGSGRAVFAAALTGLFRTCLGVELLPHLCAAAEGLRVALHRHAAAHGVSEVSLPEIAFVEADLANAAVWAHADTVYVASLCFSDSLMQALVAAGAGLRPGARMLSLERLPVESRRFFALDGCEQMVMSWGECDVYLYRRL